MSAASIALNRFGLGARPGDRVDGDPKRWLLAQFDAYDPRPAAIASLPPSATIARDLADYLEQARQLRRANGAQPQQPEQRRGPVGYVAPQAMAAGDAMTAQPAMPAQSAAKPPLSAAEQARAFARKQGREYYGGAVAARSLAALNGPSPFVERLVHFWSNHFAVSADKLTVVGLAGAFEFEAIRPHVLGNFGDLLGAVERHPAMLLYLDQAQSVGPNSVAGQFVARRRPGQAGKLGLNENLAREIMELHTLGVRTGYSQADVTEFARAMTGWTVAGLNEGTRARFAGTEGTPGAFIFADRLHEPGVRTILGKNYDQAGEKQAAAVLSDLATSPATARHVSTKLARHFAGDEPPPALVARMEATWLKTGGHLPSVYRVLIDAPECWVEVPVKFKSPWEWSVSSLRALGTRELQPQAMVGLLRELGQPVWQPGSPAGYDDIAASWVAPDAVLRRVEAAQRLASRARDTIDARQRAPELFPAALSSATAQAIARAESPGQGVALMLVAPEFMRR